MRYVPVPGAAAQKAEAHRDKKNPPKIDASDNITGVAVPRCHAGLGCIPRRGKRWLNKKDGGLR